MKRREFTIALAASVSLLAAPFGARAANPGQQLAPTAQKPPAEAPLESTPEPPTSGTAWGELLATLPPARRLGFVIEQLVLCEPFCFADIFEAIGQVDRDHAQFGWPRRTTVEQLRQVMQRPAHTEGLPPRHIRRAVNAFVRADRGQAPPLGEAQYSAIHAVACADYRRTTGGPFVPGSAGPVRYIAKANAEAFARFNALRAICGAA